MTTLNQNRGSIVSTFSLGEVSSPEYWARRKRWSYSEISSCQKDRHPRPSSVHRTSSSSNTSSAFDKTAVDPGIGNVTPSYQNSNGIVVSKVRITDHQRNANSNFRENCNKESIQREFPVRSGADCDGSKGIAGLGIVVNNLSSAKSNDFCGKTATNSQYHAEETSTKNDSGRHEGLNYNGHRAQEMKRMRGSPRNYIKEPTFLQHKTLVTSRPVSDKDHNLGISHLKDNVFETPSLHHIQSDASCKRNINHELSYSEHVIPSGFSCTASNKIEISPSKSKSEHLHNRKTDLKPPTWRPYSGNNTNTNNTHSFCKFSTQVYAQENSLHQSGVTKEGHHSPEEDPTRNQLQMNSCKLATNHENKFDDGFVAPSLYKSEFCTIDTQFANVLPTSSSVHRLIKPCFGVETIMNWLHQETEVAEDYSLPSVGGLGASQKSVGNVGASPFETEHKQLTAIERIHDYRKHIRVTGLNDKETTCLRRLENSADICSKYANESEKPKQFEGQLFDATETPNRRSEMLLNSCAHPAKVREKKVDLVAECPVMDRVSSEECKNRVLCPVDNLKVETEPASKTRTTTALPCKDLTSSKVIFSFNAAQDCTERALTSSSYYQSVDAARSGRNGWKYLPGADGTTVLKEPACIKLLGKSAFKSPVDLIASAKVSSSGLVDGLEISNHQHKFEEALQKEIAKPVTKTCKLSLFPKTTENPNVQKSSAVCDSLGNKQFSDRPLNMHHGMPSGEAMQHEDAGEINALNNSGNTTSKHDKSLVSAEKPFATGKSSGTPAQFEISLRASSKNNQVLSEHTLTRAVMHANLMPESKVGPSVSNQVPTSTSWLPGNPRSSYHVPTSTSLLQGNCRSSYQIPISASLLPGIPGSSYPVPTSPSLLSGKPGSSYHVPTSTSMVQGNCRLSYLVPTSASLLPHEDNCIFSYHGASVDELPLRLEQSVLPCTSISCASVINCTSVIPCTSVMPRTSAIPCTSVVPCTSLISCTSVMPCTSVIPCMSDKDRCQTLYQSNKQVAEIMKLLRRTDADIHVLNEIIRDSCQRLEAKCQLKHQLLADRRRMLRDRDIVVRDQLSEVVPSSSVQEEDVKISALSSHSRDKSMTMGMLIPGGTAPLLKTLELSNYKRNSSLIEMESVHANCSTSPIMERSEALMAKPEEETRNTQMPNQCITAGSLGHSTSSVCCGNELFSTSALCQSFPCGLIHESLTEKKQESLLPLPKSYEAVLQGDKNVVWGKTDPLISLPERDLESCKKAEVVFIPRRPGSISEHHEMELCCKSAELHTPFGIFASNVAQVVSVASTTSSEGFSARVEGYSLILNKINFQGKNENKFTVVDSVKGSICYNEAPTSGQSLQGAQTQEDKPRSCSSALRSPTQKRKSRKARNERRCSGGISMLSSDSSDSEVFQAGRALRASSPVLIKKQRRKRRSPVEQLLKDYLHQVSSSDVDIDGLESPQLAELKSPTL